MLMTEQPQRKPAPYRVRRVEDQSDAGGSLGEHGLPNWECWHCKKVLMELQLLTGVAYKRCPKCHRMNRRGGDVSDG
jgi:hypothetical protein